MGAFTDVVATRDAQVPVSRRVHLVANLGLLARRAQPGGVHRVDADVGAIGGVDDAEEQPLHGGRNRDAFREEDHALPPGQPLASASMIA